MTNGVMYWVVVAIALCVAVYLNATCDPDLEYFNRKPLACYFEGETK